MNVIVKIVVYTTVIVSCSEQFVFPDSLHQAVREKIGTSGSNVTVNKKMSPELGNEYPVTDAVQLSNGISQRNLIEDDTFCEDGSDFCQDPFNYPSKAIRKAFRKQKRIVKSMFDTDLSSSTFRLRSGLDIFLGSENVCGMLTTHIRPKAARNKKGQFKFLVNGGEGVEEYIQLVKISKCLGAGEACGNGKIFTRDVTECRQEFTDHKLVALDEEGKELVIDTFSFPSCCSCYMHRGLEL